MVWWRESGVVWCGGVWRKVDGIDVEVVNDGVMSV